jgi:quercetin dioxygenase-like cupin family protein
MDMPEEPLDRNPDSSPESMSLPDHHTHTLAAPMLQFDLRIEAEQLRAQDSYPQGSPTGRTLVKEPDLRIVLMALKAGAKLKEHQASGPISIQALDGIIRLRVDQGSVELTPGELLMLESGIPHDVDAVQDAMFLLTIGRTTYQQVSDHHEPHD